MSLKIILDNIIIICYNIYIKGGDEMFIYVRKIVRAEKDYLIYRRNFTWSLNQKENACLKALYKEYIGELNSVGLIKESNTIFKIDNLHSDKEILTHLNDFRSKLAELINYKHDKRIKENREIVYLLNKCVEREAYIIYVDVIEAMDQETREVIK